MKLQRILTIRNSFMTTCMGIYKFLWNSIWSNLGKICESSIFIWSSTKTVHLSTWSSWKLSLFRKGRCLELQGICLSYVIWMATQAQPMKMVSSSALAQLCKLWTFSLHGWIMCSTYKQTSIIDAISSSFKSKQFA